LIAMFTTVTLLLSISGAQMVAQLTQSSPPPAPAAAMPAAVDTLNNGACMDSPRSVPLALQPPAVRSQQIVRIDRVVSTQTNLNEVIGFLYTLQDGSTWLGQRTPDYMSGADARAINQVLASTHLPDQAISAFPPRMRYGVSTKFTEYFRVQIPPGSLDGLRIRIDPCVAWPAGRDLPDASM
jgi:hypothetical protein